MSKKLKKRVYLITGMYTSRQEIGFQKMRSELMKNGKIVKVLTHPAQDIINPFFQNKDFPSIGFNDKLNYNLKIIQSNDSNFQLGGHSAGALLALKKATILNPERLFLISPAAPYKIWGLYYSVIRSFFKVMCNPLFAYNISKLSFSEVKYSMVHTLEKNQQEMIYDRMVGESGKFIYEVGLPFFTKDKPTFIDFSKINCPVDIFIGTEDRITPINIARELKFRIDAAHLINNNPNPPLVTLHELQGMSHWLQVEAFDYIMEYLLFKNFI